MAHSGTLYSLFTFLLAGHALTLLASLVLLVLSAIFSGCETSLFSLSAPELNRIRAGKNLPDRTISQLYANLKRLLPALLFANMAVNVLIYSLSASIAASLSERHGTGAAFGFSLASLFVVVFFGEVFPKQFAISSSRLVARLTAVPVWFVYRALERPLRALTALVAACERLAVRSGKDSRDLREEELRLLVELSKNDGVISDGEYELIDGIVELPAVRVRDLMIPRVDARALPLGSTVPEALAAARKTGHCKMPVLGAESGEPAGWLDVRDIDPGSGGAGADGDLAAAAYLRKFQFFSEHDRADQVLERIKGGGEDLYAVVDERGQIAGFFTLQDIMDEVLGRFGESGAPPPTEVREEDGLYVISGRLSVREWRELFNVSAAIPKSATVGGLVVSLLGRVPRSGDRVRLENMEMTVRSTWRNRVAEVSLRLIKADGNGKEKEK